MGNFYRVTVHDEDGATVLELMAPAAMLVNFGPAALAAVLDVKEPTGDSPEPDVSNDGSGQPKERRPRRTKAQMEAARLAEQATAENRAVAQVGETADTVIEQSAEPVATQPEAPAPAPAYNPFG